MSVAILIVGAVSIGGARQPAVSRCGRVRRVAPVAQGDADIQRPTGQRDGPQSEPVYRLPDDRRPSLTSPGRRATKCPATSRPTATRRTLPRRPATSGGCTSRRTKPADGTGAHRLSPAQRGAAADGDRAGCGAGRRRDRLVRRRRDEQDRPRFPRARPAAVRRQALSALRGIRRVFSEGRARRARNAARVSRTSTTPRRSRPRCTSTRRTCRTGRPAIPAGRTAKGRG